MIFLKADAFGLRRVGEGEFDRVSIASLTFAIAAQQLVWLEL